MASVTGYTALKMQEIEASTVVGGFVDIHGRLLLATRGGDEIDAGSVVGPKGDTGTGPTGTVAMFAGDVAPAGHLLCLGQAVSRTAYSSLFAVIGTKYGAGDGVTTFNLPNFKGRVPVGQDPAQTEFDVVGEVGGEKTHLLTASESGLVGHNHTQNSHNHTQNSHTHTQNSHNHTQNSHNHTQNSHTHGLPGGIVMPSPRTGSTSAATQGGGTYGFQYLTAPASAGIDAATAVNQAATATNNAATATNQAATAVNQAATATNNAVAAASAAQAHNNLQPYIVMNYIIKT